MMESKGEIRSVSFKDIIKYKPLIQTKNPLFPSKVSNYHSFFFKG